MIIWISSRRLKKSSAACSPFVISPASGSYHESITRPRTHESLLHAHHTSTPDRIPLLTGDCRFSYEEDRTGIPHRTRASQPPLLDCAALRLAARQPRPGITLWALSLICHSRARWLPRARNPGFLPLRQFAEDHRASTKGRIKVRGLVLDFQNRELEERGPLYRMVRQDCPYEERFFRTLLG